MFGGNEHQKQAYDFGIFMIETASDPMVDIITFIIAIY